MEKGPFEDAEIIDCRVPANELYNLLPPNLIPPNTKFQLGVVVIVKRGCDPKIAELAAARAGVTITSEISNEEKALVTTQKRAIIQDLLAKHGKLDKGTLTERDHQLNINSVKGRTNEGLPERIFSAYDVDGEQIWIITEWHEAQTTILLPDEY